MTAQLDRAYVRARPTRLWSRLLAATLFEGRPLTARARWLNALTRLSLAASAALPRRGVRAPIFLVGSGRSGTTWLAKVLSLHPEVGFLNEPKALWHRAFPGEDLVGNYTDSPARLVLTEGDATLQAARVLRQGYGAFLALSGTTRVLDKYPELVFRTGLVQALLPDARFLFLAREGSAACRSVAAWSARHGAPGVDWWGRDARKYRILVEQGAALEPDLAAACPELARLTRQEDRAALEWILAMRAGLGAFHRAPERVRPVSYERLVADPRAVLLELFEFLGLLPDPRPVRYALASAAKSTRAPALELPSFLRTPFASTQARLDTLFGRPT